MKALLLILLLASSAAAQTFTQGERVRVFWHGQYRSAICLNNVRYNDIAVEVRLNGRRWKIETLAVSDVRKVRR